MKVSKFVKTENELELTLIELDFTPTLKQSNDLLTDESVVLVF